MTLRHRGGPSRAVTFAEGTTPSLHLLGQRRNSTLSDSVSDARHSIRSSTDDLLLPRAARRGSLPVDYAPEESHWQSAPLGLALLPAIAGVFFKNGSAVVTDVTLLMLAGIFLNWSVRLPWDWYRSAQAVRLQDRYYDTNEDPPEVAVNDSPDELAADGHGGDKPSLSVAHHKRRMAEAKASSTKELQIHELAALLSCFAFPMIGTWILHTIRDKLSRPSEGLVSNYNLTIFLLAAEIRPFAHLLKMVQARTLHLQRVVASSATDEKDSVDAHKVLDLEKRLEELEAHVAEAAAQRLASESSKPDRDPTVSQQIPNSESLVSQTASEVRGGIQPDIDALTRAVRRYEKRTTVSAYQTDSRLEHLENRVTDALSLAAAAHHTSSQRPRGVVTTFFDWVYAIVLLPVQVFFALAGLPIHLTRRCLRYGKDFFVPRASPKPRRGKSPVDRVTPSPRRSRRVVGQPDGEVRGLKPIREYN